MGVRDPITDKERQQFEQMRQVFIRRFGYDPNDKLDKSMLTKGIPVSTPIYDSEVKRVTTDEHGGPTSTPQPKVLAATAGAGVGAAISTIAIYLIETLGSIDLPDVVEGAIGVLLAAGVGFLAGYIKRPSGVN